MAGELQAFLGRFEIDALSQSITMAFTASGTPAGNQLVSLDTGEFYMKGHSGESTEQLTEHIQAKIRAFGSDYASATCSLDLSTGLITFTFAYSVQLTWTDPLLGSYLGWGSNPSPGTSIVAPNPARFVWRPSLSPSKLPTDLTTFWEPFSNTSMHLAPDGTPTTTPGALQNRASIAYDLLELSEVLVDENGLPAGNATFEQYYRDTCHGGKPSRIILDRTAYATADDYKVALFGQPDGQGEIGPLRDWIAPVHGEAAHDLWDVDLFFAEYTGAGA
jgi:hypothetical protein